VREGAYIWETTSQGLCAGKKSKQNYGARLGSGERNLIALFRKIPSKKRENAKLDSFGPYNDGYAGGAGLLFKREAGGEVPLPNTTPRGRHKKGAGGIE